MKKFYLFALPFIIGLSGCNQQTQAPEPKTAETVTPATTQTNTNAPAATSGEPANNLPADAPVVRVAMTGIDEPFNFKDERGSLIGVEHDIVQAIANSQGFKVEPIIVSPNSLLTGLDAKNYDLVVAVFSYTPERASKYNVSNPYFYSPSAIMYKNSELNITNYKDLGGLRVAVGGGSFHEQDLRAMKTIQQLDIVDSTYLMLQGLAQDKYDAVVQDQTMLQYTTKNHPNVKVSMSPYYAQENKNNDGLVMIMNKDNNELLEKVNKGIDEIKASGKLDEISQKWLGMPAPAFE